jgi:hypothetical protein
MPPFPAVVKGRPRYAIRRRQMTTPTALFPLQLAQLGALHKQRDALAQFRLNVDQGRTATA